MSTASVKPIIFEMPFTPPTVNHYKKPIKLKTANGTIPSYALTDEAKAWYEAMGYLTRGQTLTPSTPAACREVRYAISATVFLGAGEREH